MNKTLQTKIAVNDATLC